MLFNEDSNHKVISIGHIHMGAQVLTIGIEYTTGLVDSHGNNIPPKIVFLIERESHEPVQINLGGLKESSEFISLLVDARLKLQEQNCF